MDASKEAWLNYIVAAVKINKTETNLKMHNSPTHIYE